ncbi:hypothetical protein BDW22DRAFT_1350018 [Trametopsis cervina]|nr:hypothetical protein BDW22DRAFT_1350018 [Trametopsis cervina]
MINKSILQSDILQPEKIAQIYPRSFLAVLRKFEVRGHDRFSVSSFFCRASPSRASVAGVVDGAFYVTVHCRVRTRPGSGRSDSDGVRECTTDGDAIAATASCTRGWRGRYKILYCNLLTKSQPPAQRRPIHPRIQISAQLNSALNLTRPSLLAHIKETLDAGRCIWI